MFINCLQSCSHFIHIYMILYKQGLKGVRTIPNCRGGEPLGLSHGDTWRTYPK
nr:MAG TPA: hypothetical protein [Caudoviricetes sp.]